MHVNLTRLLRLATLLLSTDRHDNDAAFHELGGEDLVVTGETAATITKLILDAVLTLQDPSTFQTRDLRVKHLVQQYLAGDQSTDRKLLPPPGGRSDVNQG